MNIRRCHRIALRIDALLQLELRQGIDNKRMLTEALYARDVLLVCDAHPGTDLAALAHHYRAAVAEASVDAGPSSGLGSDFKSSRRDSLPPAPAAQKEAASAWFSPSRWLGK